jgi:2,4-dienoyl-CoA reductase-like NADH-dependent reductase (Old Yellow Enzyme family)
VHAEGGKIVPQLWHVGSVRRIGTEPDASVPGYGPSEKLKDGQVVVHGMTKQDIQDVIAAFAQAADAQSIGMDGVEIHGAHGYLIDQFFWEGSNQRTDEYGGSLANRSRFAIELIQAVRAAVGEGFPIIFRFSQWKQQDYTARLVQTPQALGEFLQPLSDAGVDIFHCSTRRFWEPEFDGSELNLAGWTRKLTGKPTITVGSVGLDGEFLQFMVNTDKVAQPASLEKLLERLNNDEFDLVAVGRALLVDPDWAQKVREGREQDILPFSREALMTLVKGVCTGPIAGLLAMGASKSVSVQGTIDAFDTTCSPTQAPQLPLELLDNRRPALATGMLACVEANAAQGFPLFQ